MLLDSKWILGTDEPDWKKMQAAINKAYEEADDAGKAQMLEDIRKATEVAK